MKQYETKVIPPVPAREEQVVVGLACDLCGRKAKRPQSGWAEGTFEIADTEVSVTVKLRHGASYGDGSYKKVFAVDLCPECFKSRLLPWLESQGVKVREEEIEW